MASTARVLRADLLRALPAQAAEHSPKGLVAFCPARAALASADTLPREMDLDQAQVSILDDDHGMAQAMARLLRAEGFSARIVGSAREFLAQPEPARETCVIADASMPDTAGLALQQELTARQWLLPIIFLISAGDTRTVVKAMKGGAINCLPKPVQRAELLEAVREALAESRAVRAQRAAQLRVRQMLERLTPREREVLDLALDGLLVKQIAARLGTAEKTIKTHKGRLLRKMEVRSTLALVQLMITTGISLRPAVSEPVMET